MHYKLMCIDRNINGNRDVKFLECDYLLVQRCVKLTLRAYCPNIYVWWQLLVALTVAYVKRDGMLMICIFLHQKIWFILPSLEMYFLTCSCRFLHPKFRRIGHFKMTTFGRLSGIFFDGLNSRKQTLL